MRGDYQRERTSVLIWLISAIIAGFILQLLVLSPWVRDGSEVIRGLALTIPGVRAGWIWTLLTYSFLHNPHFIFHIVGNVFLLFLLGRELLPMLGSKRFLGLYAAATIVGGLAWTAVHWRYGGAGQMHMGATAAIDALFVVFACFFPNQELNFLLLFLFPVTVKPKYVAAALVAFDLFSLVFWELPNTALPYDAVIASSAHLGGMLTGFVYYRFMYDSNWFGRGEHDEVELPRWLKRAKKAPAAPAEFRLNVATPEEIRAQVDRILDKINSQGFAALTPEEKRLLDEARAALSRR
jgi:membrane associated rhomboid family serine protease